jgi:hypothetical protein
MKGQMIFEFVVAAMLFFAILFYIISFLSTNFGQRTATVAADNLKMKEIQLSGDIIVNGNINKSFINITCEKGIIDGTANFKIKTIWPNGTIIENYNNYNLTCGRETNISGIRRVGLLDGIPVVVNLAIW